MTGECSLCYYRRPVRSCRQLALPLAALLAAGCSGQERAVRVTFDVVAPGDTLCVLAGDGRAPTFVERYAVEGLPDPATLTFVAGSTTRRDVVIGGHLLRGGRSTGTGHVAVTLDAAGTLERSMQVNVCRRGAPTGLGISPSGTFATLSSTSRLFGADFDGDGREELLGIAVDGALAMLEAEDPLAGSRRVTELVTEGGRLVASGDYDGDCRIDLLATASTGLLRVNGSDGSSPAPLSPASVVDAAVIELVAGTGPRLAVATLVGVFLLDPLDGSMTELSDEPSTFVVALDLDGDGRDDLVSGGVGSATRAFFGGSASYREAEGSGTGPLSEAIGPGVLGDFDGDGLEDVALVDAAGVRVLSFSSGELDAFAAEGTFTTIDRLSAGDLDGDCIADLVLLEEGAVRFFHGGPSGLEERTGPAIGGTLDLEVADVDGDGAREVALLGGGGRVNLWRP